MSRTKTCTGCNEEKPMARFSRNRRAGEGKCWRCKDCEHAYYLEHRSSICRRVKKCAASKREEIKERQAEYYQLHRDKLRAASSANYALNRKNRRAKQDAYYL